MKPNYNELPIPNTKKGETISKENQIEKLITNKKSEDINSEEPKDINETFEESLLKKIKKD